MSWSTRLVLARISLNANPAENVSFAVVCCVRVLWTNRRCPLLSCSMLLTRHSSRMFALLPPLSLSSLSPPLSGMFVRMHKYSYYLEDRAQ
ncbi:hypothetical protein BD309DRAFT_970553 [Dichomitus squalens]|nr:hypothetical protein BD309DRAFT_970553 [Dichomitus squalens]